MSATESTNLTAKPGHDERRRAYRFSYSSSQELSYYPSEGIPPAESFVKVRCRDLSDTGVGIYVDREPPYPEVVIAFRISDQRYYVRATVMHTRMVELDGRQVFLLGCHLGEEIK